MKPSEGLESEEDRNVSNMRMLHQAISFVNTKIFESVPELTNTIDSIGIRYTTLYFLFIDYNSGGSWQC